MLAPSVLFFSLTTIPLILTCPPVRSLGGLKINCAATVGISWAKFFTVNQNYDILYIRRVTAVVIRVQSPLSVLVLAGIPLIETYFLWDLFCFKYFCSEDGKKLLHTEIFFFLYEER